MMRAIPTTYAAVQFRSRLEADVAHWFDTHRVAWEYEREAFTLRNGMNYLPDFWLPEIRTWCEVKGAHGERIDKTTAFAEQLVDEFVASGNPDDQTHPDFPIVLIATPVVPGVRSRRDVSFTGTYSRTRRYSIFPLRCDWCKKTFFGFFDGQCRVCGWWPQMCNGHGDQPHPSWFDIWLEDVANTSPLSPAPVARWQP